MIAVRANMAARVSPSTPSPHINAHVQDSTLEPTVKAVCIRIQLCFKLLLYINHDKSLYTQFFSISGNSAIRRPYNHRTYSFCALSEIFLQVCLFFSSVNLII